jgi:hypothetical protein
MINRKFLGLVMAAGALAASAVPAGAATHPVSLQMPGGSTWGNLSAPAPPACDAASKDACK